MQNVVAFDLEIAKDLPEGGGDWRDNAPLGITCAATLDSDGNLRLWHGSVLRADFMSDRYLPKMSREECRELAMFLVEMQAEGYTVVTWNGCGFDIPVLAMECGDLISHDNLCDLALAHIDMGFAMLCEKGFMVGLDTAAKGMRLAGKTEGMHGDLAPAMWRQGREAQDKVLEYVAQDVRTTLEVFEAISQRGFLEWISRSGRLNIWHPAEKRLHTVEEALATPEPETSWMSGGGWPRSKFVGWLNLEGSREEYHAINLDDFAEESFQWLGSHQDGRAGHYARYTGTKEECVQKCLDGLRPLIEKMMYTSDDYGCELKD